MATKEQVIDVLGKLLPPEKISGVVINGGHIGFALLTQDEDLRRDAEKQVFALPGVEKVTAVLTGEKGEIKSENKNAAVLNRQQIISNVKKVIMIASGKGGVGKSTVTVNLAVTAALAGHKVGLVDADIYGPSIPQMLGIKKLTTKSQKPEFIDGKMIPFKAHGILCNSVGFLLADNDAAIWRGPMAVKALHQLFIGTNWGELDYLFIDMPPGTGDIALSLAQNYKIDGAVLVTTPQQISLIDVKRAFSMFARVKIPILGLVENMSFYESGGEKQFIFGERGGEKFAEANHIKFLGAIALYPTLRRNSDHGLVEPNAEFNEIFENLKMSANQFQNSTISIPNA